MSDIPVPSAADASYLQQRLRAQTNCWRRVLDHIDEGVVIVDHTGVIREVNRAAASWLQQPDDQLIGQPWDAPLVTGPFELNVADQVAYFEAELEPIEWNEHPAHLIMLRPAAPANQLTAAACTTLLHAIPEVVLITRLSAGLIVEASDFATSFRTSAGQVMPVLVSGRVVELDGQACVLLIACNISEWRQMEEALQTSRERYRTLIQNVPLAIYRTTPGGVGRVPDDEPRSVREAGLHGRRVTPDQRGRCVSGPGRPAEVFR